MQLTFRDNKEQIKTSQHGRNTGIFGVSHELLYTGEGANRSADCKFSVIDPREIIVLYDYDIDPQKVCAIRVVCLDEEGSYEVYVYYKTVTEVYAAKSMYLGAAELKVSAKLYDIPNYFYNVPVVSYYINRDDYMGLIDPVLPLIDDYDLLMSDSLNEFNRFTHSYLRLVGMSIDNQIKSASADTQKQGLFNLKKRRVFEQLKDKDDVTFLTKDIPTAYITYMSQLIREQIHTQSHVPDLNTIDGNMSGVAIQRLMFDFENVVSSCEAEFDGSLFERMKLINSIYQKTGRALGDPSEITISHKRNAPLNLLEFSQISQNMKNAGFSSYLVCDVWPDDVIPDVQEELDRQKSEREENMDLFADTQSNTSDDQDTDQSNEDDE